jgi:hypothetical protein
MIQKLRAKQIVDISFCNNQCAAKKKRVESSYGTKVSQKRWVNQRKSKNELMLR